MFARAILMCIVAFPCRDSLRSSSSIWRLTTHQLPPEKKRQYNAKVRDWRRLAKLGMRLGRTEPPRYPFITAEEALNIPTQTPEEAEFWRMVDDYEETNPNSEEIAEEDRKVRRTRPIFIFLRVCAF